MSDGGVQEHAGTVLTVDDEHLITGLLHNIVHDVSALIETARGIDQILAELFWARGQPSIHGFSSLIEQAHRKRQLPRMWNGGSM